MKDWYDPRQIRQEYEQCSRYKASLGERGLYEQSRVNERFFVGDQWHGARCGNDRPLVRHNVIKRIGEYKMAAIGASPVAVDFSADGVASTPATQEAVRDLRARLAGGGELTLSSSPDEVEINLVMSALNDYFRATAERVKLEELREQALRDAYTGGTGVLYTYWDETVTTGQYADEAHTVPIRGDLACEVLDIENVGFGDPACTDVQAQPYIVLSARRTVEDIRRLARRYGASAAVCERIVGDTATERTAGDYGRQEQAGTARTTLLTKFYRVWSRDGRSSRIWAVQVCGDVTVRPAWDTGLHYYPLALFRWERRKNCAYGESEIQHLIPNQIAINRMLTASVWAVMMMGMPIMVLNGDIVQGPVTNEPGQIVRVFGGAGDVQNAMRYVNPPSFSPEFDRNISSLITNTLTQSGANDAALGDIKPDNTSAIIAVREAAMLPLQSVKNRYYNFLEELARIWADVWFSRYGERGLRIEDADGVWYLPFCGARYRDLVVRARVDVGAATLWSEAQSIQTLDGLFGKGVISAVQYLKRLPRGIVPEVTELVREMEEADAAVKAAAEPAVDRDGVLNGLSPRARAQFEALPTAVRERLLNEALRTPPERGESV